MKRLSIVTLSVFLPFVALAAPACSSESSPDEDKSNNTTSGSGNTSAGTGNLAPLAGSSSSAAGTSTGGTTSAAGSGSGGVSAGTSSGGSTAGTAAAVSGGTSAGGSGGAATAGAGGSGTDPSCPAKIDSKTPCTAVATCGGVYCGVFKLGSKGCSCAAASGMFTCTSCDYAGKTEEIVVPPASALPACAADDTTLEATTGCTKGTRCRSTDAAKIRFCACWDDPVDGSTVWDCDAIPASWPK